MSRTRIQEIVTLTREGWRPYDAEPERSVYEGTSRSGLCVTMSSAASAVRTTAP